jgi:hypothetical protein
MKERQCLNIVQLYEYNDRFLQGHTLQYISTGDLAFKDTHSTTIPISAGYSPIDKKGKNKAIPVTGREDREDVEAPTFSLDIRFTDGSKFVSLTHRPPFTPQEDSWYSFLLEAE